MDKNKEIQDLLKYGSVFKEFRGIYKQKDIFSYQRWREGVKEKVISLINRNQHAFTALKEMLQCIRREREQDIDSNALFSYSVSLVSVFVPVMIFVTGAFYNFSSDIAKIQNDVVGNAVESIRIMNDSLVLSVKEAGVVISIVLIVLWAINGIQTHSNYNKMMYKLYIQELVDIVDTIDVLARGKE